MRCPACQLPLHEFAPACAHCSFDLAVAARIFGAPPQMEFPLTDPAGAIGPAKKRAVTMALLEMSQTFPQLSFAAVLVQVDAQIPLPAHTFWLFNTGGLTAPQESGGLCRLVLLELDVTNSRAACMIGYGLEPFIPQTVLDRIAAAALPDLQRQDHAAAILAALQCARTEFAAVAETITRGFGLSVGGQTAGARSEEAAFAY